LNQDNLSRIKSNLKGKLNRFHPVCTKDDKVLIFKTCKGLEEEWLKNSMNSNLKCFLSKTKLSMEWTLQEVLLNMFNPAKQRNTQKE
jgi:hypothetical protein